MWSWVDTMAQLVAANPAAALTIAFLGAIIEAVAIFGTIIPGTVILMAVAGAAAMAGQSMIPYVLLAIVGAIVGDGLSYAAGRCFHDRVRKVWPFSRRPELMDSAERFFRRYGMASVALCRFIPVLRSNVPLFAGMASMPARHFLFANVLSACVWAPAHIFPAQMAGLLLSRLEQNDWQDAALWGAGLLACLLAGWAVHSVMTAARRADGAR